MKDKVLEIWPEINWIKDEDSGIEGVLSFFINARYMIGAEAEYLKEGAITFSDPQDGPVQTKTDLQNICFGCTWIKSSSANQSWVEL